MPPVLYSLVLSARGETAADVALGLVLLEDLLHLQIQRPVVDRQPLGQVLMYRGFADTELLRRRADGRSVFNQVKGQRGGPLLHVPLQAATLLRQNETLHRMRVRAALCPSAPKCRNGRRNPPLICLFARNARGVLTRGGNWLKMNVLSRRRRPL